MTGQYLWKGRKSLFITLCILQASIAFSQRAIRTDSCLVNDICENAIELIVSSDPGFNCIDGCNIGATPEQMGNSCGLNNNPTVWYKLRTEFDASLLNIHVTSDDIESPVISLFYSFFACDHLHPIPLSWSQFNCFTGKDGMVRAISTKVTANANYYIAVGSLDTIGGTFQLCANTISETNQCNGAATEINVVSRSHGGPLDGPFHPGETVNVCLSVSSFSAGSNGCQWFQGIIPRFGSGWDPSSFDADGQPRNATINDMPIGQQGNGLYRTSTWDWFDNVGYHHDYPLLQVDDFDNDGIREFCHDAYEIDCQWNGGLIGGCCGPCWFDTPGEVLPPGWFAYGIDGTCYLPGPPVHADWGDGNTCGCCMGPWNFCFDLTVRDYDDCLLGGELTDLDVSFIITSDGETGAWTEDQPLCINNTLTLRDYQVRCVTEIVLPADTIGPQCSLDPFVITIDEPGVDYWYWTADIPGSTVQDVSGSGPNGSVIEEMFYNYRSDTMEVVIRFWSEPDSNDQVYTKDFVLLVFPTLIKLPDETHYVCKYMLDPLVLDPAFSKGYGAYTYLWEPGGSTDPTLTLSFPFEAGVYSVTGTDENECTAVSKFTIRFRNDCSDIVIEDNSDDTYEGPMHEDTIPGGNLDAKQIHVREGLSEKDIKVYPQPVNDMLFVEWRSKFDFDRMIIYDLNGIQRIAIPFSSEEKLERKSDLDVSHLNDGVYVLVFYAGDVRVVKKLVKM